MIKYIENQKYVSKGAIYGKENVVIIQSAD